MIIPTVKQNIKIQPFSLDELRQTYLDFLCGDRSTKIYNYLYRDELSEIHLSTYSGIGGWDKALKKDNKYYIYQNEIELISQSVDSLEKLPYCSTLIELGIGSEKAVLSKSLQILKALKPQHFVINDISRKAVFGAVELIEKELPGLSIHPVVSDFLDENSDIYKISDANVVITGSTISNITMYNGQLPVDDVTSYLKLISRLIGSKGTLIITQDTNQDEVSLRAAYSEPDLIRFRINMLHRLNKFLNVKEFDLSILQYEPIWDPGCHLYANTFINTLEQEIQVGNKKIILPTGQRLYVSNCYKYPALDFIHMVKMAGLSPVWTKHDQEQKVFLHALRRI